MAFIRLNGSLEDYRRKVELGLAQFHDFGKGEAITEVVDYTNPDERVLNVLLLAGEDFDSWKEDADKKLVSFARVNGCRAIEFACRLGLYKKIAHMGYQKKKVLARKDLDESRGKHCR